MPVRRGPTEDNAAIYEGDEAAANDAWLDTFTKMLEEVKRTKGFVLQIQQGVVREKTKMQEAEERMGGWLDVPRIGVFAFPITHVRGGGTPYLIEQYVDKAIAAAQAQWEKGVWKDVQMVSPVFEAVEGELQLNERGNVEGFARCTWPDGNSYAGQFHHGLKHGQGTFKWAHGDAYSGDYERDKMHGRGTHSHANGDVVLSLYDANQRKGPGIWLEKASGRYFLLKDGQVACELNRAEACQLAFRDLFGAHFLCARLSRSSKSTACRSCCPEAKVPPSLTLTRRMKEFCRSDPFAHAFRWKIEPRNFPECVAKISCL